MTADIPFYVDLAVEAATRGSIVELAVGNGRVAIPVARATSQLVTGVDSSPAMLAQARDNARRAGVELDLRQEDMRTFTVGTGAALVYCPFRALLHLPTWWLGLVDVAGLKVEALYGGSGAEPFTDDSREYVFVATKPSP